MHVVCYLCLVFTHFQLSLKTLEWIRLAFAVGVPLLKLPHVSPQVWSTFKWPTPRWPLYLYLSGVLVCLLCSSLCHLLGNSYRQLVRYIWRVDYAGITYLIVTSFYPLANYVFLCRPFFTYLYTTTITVLGVALLAVTWFEVFQTARFRYIRPGIFAGMGLSGLLPVLQAAVMYRHVPEVSGGAAVGSHGKPRRADQEQNNRRCRCAGQKYERNAPMLCRCISQHYTFIRVCQVKVSNISAALASWEGPVIEMLACNCRSL